MMLTDERLAAAMRELTPEPPTELTGADVRARATVPLPARGGRGRTIMAWVLPVAAAAAFVVAVVLGLLAVLPRTESTGPGRQHTVPQPTPTTCPTLESGRPGVGTPSRLLLAPRDLGTSVTSLQEPKPGISNLLYGLDTSPQWQVIESGRRLPDTTAAERYARTLVAVFQCGGELLHLDASGSLPATWFLRFPPSTTDHTAGTREVVTVVGADVLDLFVSTADTRVLNADPGDDFLVSLATAVRAKAAGQPAPRVIAPQTTAPEPLPAGFLTVADLGAGWVVGSLEGDRAAVTDPSVPRSGSCGSLSLAPVEPGQSVMYRGHQPLGDGEWLLDETVVRLAPPDVAKARTTLSRAPAGCPTMRELFRGTGIAGDYALALRFRQDAGFADVYVLVGDRLLHLQTLPGGASGQHVPLPGDTDWLRSTARAAADQLAAASSR